MLDKIKTFIENASTRETFDPSKFNDPVAEKTEWIPLKRGGTNMKTHNLVEKHPQRVEFKMTVGILLFSILFIIVGVFAGVFISWDVFSGVAQFTLRDHWPALLFFFSFSGTGLIVLRSGSKPIVFDKHSGFYWKGRTEPDISTAGSEQKDNCRLSDIYAIQILRERVRGDEKSYNSYELNLVKKDGNRLNVVDHGKRDAIRADANKLSEFLGKPVWDIS